MGNTNFKFDCCEINHDLWGHELLIPMNYVAVKLYMTCLHVNAENELKFGCCDISYNVSGHELL